MEMTMTFEADEVTVGLSGASETAEYSISPDDKLITIKDPEDEDGDPLEITIVEKKDNNIKIEINGTSGSLSKKSSKSEESSEES